MTRWDPRAEFAIRKRGSVRVAAASWADGAIPASPTTTGSRRRGAVPAIATPLGLLLFNATPLDNVW